MNRILIILSVLCVLMVGCSKKQHVEEAVFAKDEGQHVVSILLDMSGSFEDLMAERGKAYSFCLQVIDRYFREKIGTKDRLVISMISGSDRALLWEGRPLELRKDFPTAKKFQKFLKEKANVGGSLVHGALTQTVRYMLDDDAVVDGKTKTAVFVLSDMLDTSGAQTTSDTTSRTPKSSIDNVTDALSEYAESGGVIGIYYCDQHLCSAWKDRLKDVGFKSGRFRVESEIVGRPQLPRF